MQPRPRPLTNWSLRAVRLELGLFVNFKSHSFCLPDADSALKVLGKSATWKEKQVLGSVKYLYDVTITHNDLAYMKKVQYLL